MSLYSKLLDMVRAGCPWVIGGDGDTGLFTVDELAERGPHRSRGFGHYYNPDHPWFSAQCGADEFVSGEPEFPASSPTRHEQHATDRPSSVVSLDPTNPGNACPAAQVGNHQSGSGEPAAGVDTPTSESSAFAPAAGTQNPSTGVAPLVDAVGAGQPCSPSGCPAPTPSLDDIRAVVRDEIRSALLEE